MFFNYLNILVALCFISVFNVFGQTTSVIGSSTANESSSVIQLDNYNNQYIAGSINADACVIKRNSSNQIIWTKVLQVSSTEDSEVYNLCIVGDTVFGCGMIFSGNSVSGGFVFKMDGVSGNVIWIKYNSSAKQYFSGITYSNNRLYACGARVNGGNDYYARVWSFSSATGNTIWQTPLYGITFSGFNVDYVDDIMNCSRMVNGKMYITGRSYVNGASSLDMRPILIGIDSLGTIFLQKYLLFNTATSPGDNRFYPEDVSYDGDSLVISIFGDDNCSSCTDYHPGIIKTDLMGNVGWARYYDIQNLTLEFVKGIIVNTNGYVIFGFGNNASSGQTGYVLKVSKSGSYQAARLIDASSGGNMSTLAGLLYVGGKGCFVNNVNYIPFNVQVNSTNKNILICALDNNLNDPLSCQPITPTTVTTVNFIPFSASVSLVPIATVVTTTLTTASSTYSLTSPCDNITIQESHNGDCLQDTISLTVSGTSNSTITWSNNTTGNTYIATSASPISVVVHDGINCCTIYDTIVPQFTAIGSLSMNLPHDTTLCINPGTNFTIVPQFSGPTPSLQYLWSTGSNSTTLAVSSSGQYWLEASNSCVTFRDTMNITILTYPALGNDTLYTVCQSNFPFSLNPSISNATSFIWNDGDTNLNKSVTSGGVYTITATNQCGNVDQTFTLNTINVPTIILAGPIDTCLQSQTTLELHPSSTDVLSFHWSTGATAEDIAVNSTQNYWVIGSNSCGTDTAFIDVTINFIPFINLPNVIDTCFEVGIGFPITANGNLGQYSWSNGDLGQSTWASSEGAYTCYLTNSCGVDSATVFVNRVNDFDLLIPDDSLIFCTPNISIDELHVLANFAFEVYGQSPNPLHTIDESGYYTISVSNACGSIEDSIYVFVSQNESSIYLPNSFTPNGDFTNEILVAYLSEVTIEQIQIFNRWGEKIYEEQAGFSGWDGKYKGQKCPDGIYIVKIIYNDCSQMEKEFVGHVNLLK